MTDRELIEYTRDQVGGFLRKSGCIYRVADRLEALLAENAELNIQIQKEIVKRVGVEAENERLRSAVKKLWCGKRYCKDAVMPSTEGVE